MAHTRRTLELLPDTWDLTLDAAGQIRVVGDDYATAQNVANEIRLFTNDAYLAQDQGIPHFAVELGQKYSDSPLVKAFVRTATRLVGDVDTIVSINIAEFTPETRVLSGSVTFTTVSGTETSAVTTYF